MPEQVWSFYPELDAKPRVDDTWSDTTLYPGRHLNNTFVRLKCGNCGGMAFEVLQVGPWTTAAKCVQCNAYYIAHSG